MLECGRHAEKRINSFFSLFRCFKRFSQLAFGHDDGNEEEVVVGAAVAADGVGGADAGGDVRETPNDTSHM